MNEIDYKQAIEELIKIEEESKEKTKFQETYLNQLKRRLKIYNKGRLDVLNKFLFRLIKAKHEELCMVCENDFDKDIEELEKDESRTNNR